MLGYKEDIFLFQYRYISKFSDDSSDKVIA